MATLTCHTTRSDGVTLVELVVTSDVTERVRVENCLDGPVWPPRRQGVPEAGWDEEGYEGEVGPDDRLVAGYATPAEPCEPPARLVSVDATGDDSVTTRALVRDLGDPRPPRDGVGLPEQESGNPPDCDPPDDGVDSPATDPTEVQPVATEPPESQQEEADSDTTDSAASDPLSENTGQQDNSNAEKTPPTVDGEGLPPGFDAYLARVRERLDEAEGLAGPSTAGEASEALAAVGGPEQAAAMQEQLAADRERLARLGTECQRLAARIDAVDVPVETLARLT